MGKYTGREELIPDKVKAMFLAVNGMIHEGTDLTSCKVSDITQRAGIGKGTAYEYFETKEDIIVAAIVYSTKQIAGWLSTQLEGEQNFYQRIRILFDIIDDKMQESECVVRFFHMMTDTSVFGMKLREYGEEEGIENMHLIALLRDVIEAGIKAGEVRADIPVGYAELVLYSKIIAYLAYKSATQKKNANYEQMKQCLIEGLKREIG